MNALDHLQLHHQLQSEENSQNQDSAESQANIHNMMLLIQNSVTMMSTETINLEGFHAIMLKCALDHTSLLEYEATIGQLQELGVSRFSANIDDIKKHQDLTKVALIHAAIRKRVLGIRLALQSMVVEKAVRLKCEAEAMTEETKNMLEVAELSGNSEDILQARVAQEAAQQRLQASITSMVTLCNETMH